MGDGSLAGKECHEICFYFLMKFKGKRKLNSNSYSYSDGVKETMHWLTINQLSNYLAYPTFLEID